MERRRTTKRGVVKSKSDCVASAGAFTVVEGSKTVSGATKLKPRNIPTFHYFVANVLFFIEQNAKKPLKFAVLILLRTNIRKLS